MTNFPNNPTPDKTAAEDSRNESELPALEQGEGAKLNRARYPYNAPRPEFAAALKQQLLARRSTPMQRLKVLFAGAFALPALKPVAVTALIITIVAGSVYWLPGLWQTDNPDSPFNQFSKLIINTANAQDNFTLRPETADSTGVSGDVSYILTSKEAVATELVKENLVVTPAVPYELTSVSATEWKLTPSEPLPPNTILQVALASVYYDENGELQKRDYEWAYQVKDTFKILTVLPRNEATNVPRSTGIEITFSHDNFSKYEEYVSIAPQVAGRFETYGRTLVYVPEQPLAAGTVYTVTVKAGLPLSDGAQALAEDHRVQFETETTGGASYSWGRSYFSAYESTLEFTPDEMPVIQVYTDRENAEATVTAYRLNEQEYRKGWTERAGSPWWSDAFDRYRFDTGGRTAFRTIATPVRKGQYIQFVELPEALPVGYYVLDLAADGNTAQVWVQVTELSAYVTTTKTETVVWVNDIGSGTAVAGATITLTGLPGSWTTDAQGVARFATPAGLLTSGEARYFDITTGNKRLFLPAENAGYRYFYGETTRQSDDYWHYLYTDRPQYQPTDTIKFWGLLKARHEGGIDDTVKVSFTKEGYMDYRYNPVAIGEYAITMDEFGVFSGEIPLDSLKPDYYTLRLTVGETEIASKYIQVRPYVKPAYQLTLVPDRRAAYAGETVNLTVQASFFEGTPVPNLPLVFQMPEGEYKFTTDADGKATLTYLQKYYDCTSEYSCWPEFAWLRIRPQASELADISAETSVNFYAGRRYARAEAAYPGKGESTLAITTYELDTAVAGESYWRQDLGDTVAGNTKIAGDVYKIIHTKVQTGTGYDFYTKQNYPIYHYDTHEEKIDSFSATTDAAGKYVYRRTIEPETSYRVVVRTYDGANHYDQESHYLYYNDGTGVNRYDSYYRNFYSFDLPEDTTYAVGAKVAAAFTRNGETLPAGGKNRYLFLQLQNGLQEYQTADNPNYRFAFEERDVPNVHLAGIYFDGRAYHVSESAWWFSDSNNVTFDTAGRELTLAVTPERETYEPGEEMTVDVRVTDAAGKPVRAAVNLNVIDEAYYAVVGDTADPTGEIYAQLGSGQQFFAYSHKTLSDEGGAEGGGCFLPGTMITLADGTQKPIQDIAIGDEIKTITDPLRVAYGTGRVVETFKHTVGGYLVINDTLRVTPEHRLYSNHSWRTAGELQRGDWLLRADGTKEFITTIETVRDVVEVYNFSVEPQHTYLADGFYVHNQKGGEREFFTDAPLFASITTDANGEARTTLTLPDNVTSWRITAQAVSGDLSVGTTVANVDVTLPVFADVTIGAEYLAGDTPIARVRAYGTALTKDVTATFNLLAESLGVKRSETVTAPAFGSAYLPLPALRLGTHAITYALETPQGKDAVKLPLRVITSRLRQATLTEAELTTATTLPTTGDDLLTVQLGDRDRISLYGPLQSLSWSWSDRIDALVSRNAAQSFINEVFGEERPVSAVPAHAYQRDDGGISLLPYSDTDQRLSAELAAVAPEHFDRLALQQYFLDTVNYRDSNREEISTALYGLAALHTPILPLLNNWYERNDLSVEERLLVALAFHELGASEKARTIYYDIAGKFGQAKLPAIKIEANQPGRTNQLTALTAALAAAVQAPERDGYWYYLNHEDDAPADRTIDLQRLAYIQEIIPDLTAQPAKVTYRIKGEERTVDLGEYYVHSFQVAPADAAEVAFTAIEGNVSIGIATTETFVPAEAARDADIGIRREYYVNGRRTDTFKETDVIEVRLYPTIGNRALDGGYQITDILPSGLLPVTSYYDGYDRGNCQWYPYNAEGQTVKYLIWDSWPYANCGDHISYFARVKTRGEYVAEPALIQSTVNPDYLNFTPASGKVTIE